MGIQPGDAVAKLLDKLCTDLGFCLPAAERAKLIQSPPADPKSFTNAVFVAEGLNPEHVGRHLYRRVLKEVSCAFE